MRYLHVLNDQRGINIAEYDDDVPLAINSVMEVGDGEYRVDRLDSFEVGEEVHVIAHVVLLPMRVE